MQVRGRGNVKRFRRGLVPKAHRILYHSTLGSRVIKRQKRGSGADRVVEHLEVEGRLCEQSPRDPGSATRDIFSGESGTLETVKARFWPWLSGKSRPNVLNGPLFARNRSKAANPWHDSSN